MTVRPSMPSSPRPAGRSLSSKGWLGAFGLLSVFGTAIVLSGCQSDDEVVYVQFNTDDDALSIDVGTSDLLDAVSTDLHSTTGQVVIGSATVDPGGGPIGTEHTIYVEIADAYEDMVDRVSVHTSSPSRGEDEYDLDHDSADEGLYKYTLVSVGDEGETREDTFTVRVWDIEDDEDGSSSDDTGDTGG